MKIDGGIKKIQKKCSKQFLKIMVKTELIVDIDLAKISNFGQLDGLEVEHPLLYLSFFRFH